MSKIKSGTIRLTISEKISIGRDRVTALTGNTALAVDPAKLAQYSASVTGLQNAQAEVGNAQILMNEKFAKQVEAEKEYNLQTLAIVSEINSITRVEARLATTGFPISEKGTEKRVLDLSPGNVSASMAKKPGEIVVKWKSVKLANGYIIEYGTDSKFPQDSTKTELIGKLTKMTLKGLATGTNVWIRIRGVKGTEKGPWSDPTMTMVP